MNNILKISISATVLFLITNCSAISPYKNDFKCRGGADISYCMSVSDIYTKSEETNNFKEEKKEQIQKAKKKSKSVIEKENDFYKQENHKLKVIVKSIEAEKLRSDRKFLLLEGNHIDNVKDLGEEK